MIKKNVAVILAAGSGTRAEFSTPKQLVKLCGQPIISHTLSRFQDCALIDEIVIVVSAIAFADVERSVSLNGYSKTKKILLGGKERYESSLGTVCTKHRQLCSTQFEAKS
jgi:2-C-methyl-D-erythritol 4-phosphate cytidylyltransferase